MTDTTLPPGVHPHDKSAVWTPGFDANNPVPPDVPGSQATKNRGKPWATDNEEALGVYQRAAYAWQPGLVVVDLTNQPYTVVPRQKGRVNCSLWVPTSVIIDGTLTTTPNGVMIGSDPSEALASNCILNVGDSLDLPTEGSIYVAVIPGETSGYVQFVTLVNPIGGELGIY